MENAWKISLKIEISKQKTAIALKLRSKHTSSIKERSKYKHKQKKKAFQSLIFYDLFYMILLTKDKVLFISYTIESNYGKPLGGIRIELEWRRRRWTEKHKGSAD